MNSIALHRRALAVFADRLSTVTNDQWSAPTPCAEWDVRGLVNHVVAGTWWVAPLLSGRPTDEVTGLDGDVLGNDPLGAFQAAAAEAQAAFDRPGAAAATVAASFGSFPGREYAWQRLADVLVHAWDLAAATSGDRDLPGDLVAAVADWFDGAEASMRELGAVGDPSPVPPDADPQTLLLARFGRAQARAQLR